MYGGTKSEMERLLKDAQKITGVKYDINNLSDVYEAIHVIQGELGITGTTAKEAASTIQGSMAMAKAAYQNLITAMVSGEGLDEAIDNLADSVTIAVQNLMPAISKGLKGLGKVIKKLAPVITKALPPLIKQVLPELINTAASLVGSIAEALPGIISAALESIGTAIYTLWRTFVNSITGGVSGNTDLWYSLTKFGEKFRQTFGEIWSSLKAFFSGEIDFETLVDKVKTVIGKFKDSVVSWLQSIDWGEVWKWLWNGITNVAKWIGDAALSFAGMLGKLASGVVTWVTETVIPWVKSIDWGAVWEKMWAALSNVGAWIKEKAISFAGLLGNLANGLVSWVTDTVLPWVNSVDWGAIWQKLWNNLSDVGAWIQDKTISFVGLLGSISLGISTWVEEKLKPWVKSIDWKALWDEFWDHMTDFEEWFSDATFDFGYILGKFGKAIVQFCEDLIAKWKVGLLGLPGRIADKILEGCEPGEGSGITAMDILTKLGLTAEWFMSLPVKFINGIISAFTGQEFDLVEAIKALTIKGTEAVEDFWAWVLGEDGETGIGWFTKVAQQFFDNLGEGFMQAVANVGDWFTDMWNKIKEYFVGDGSEENGGILGKIVGFVTGAFSTDWAAAWDGVVTSFGNIFDGIVNLVRTPINSVIDFLNKMIDAVENAVNTVIRGVNSALSIKSEGFWVFGQRIGAFNWSVNIPTVKWGRIDPIPELANGGILSNGDAIWAEAGPELLSMKHGRAHVQPLSSSARTATLGNDEVLALLKQYLPQLANMQVVLDDGTLVGAMDRGLGQKIVWGARYNA